MILLASVLVSVVISHGFLLDNNNTLNSMGQPLESHQYITKSELFDAKTQLQNGIDYLRHDTNSKLVLLTSQLQELLSSLKQEMRQDVSQNDTKEIGNLEQKYIGLMENHTKLQHNFELLLMKYTQQELTLISMQNKTQELEKEISDIKNLKSIHQLTDFHTLQQEVQSINMQTNSLAVNENARTQDFQALYNLTVTSDSIIQNSIRELEVNQSGLNIKIDALERNLNLSLVDVRQQIAKNSERVALTACVNEYDSHSGGYIVQYGDIRSQVNINNINTFRSSGKFTCEKEGIYLVSSWIMSGASYASSEFSIYKNGNLVVNAFIASDPNSWYTATAVVAVELLPNDTVWIQASREMYVYNSQRSCLTIVKIK